MQGIGFTEDNVRAILLGRKTVTRRLMNPQPVMEHGIWRWQPKKGIDINLRDHADLAIPFARYRPGETYYLKEKWAIGSFSHTFREERQLQIVYAAGISDTHPDGNTTDREFRTVDAKTWEFYAFHNQWRSGMMMPEWASRRKLDMLNVRPERLQDITEEDAMREGCHGGILRQSPREQYIQLWNSINGKKVRSKEYTSTYSAVGNVEHKHYTYQPNPSRWEANLWVWRDEFRLEAKIE